MPVGLGARACLGLVLLVTGIRALMQPLASVAQLMMLDASLWDSMPVMLPLLVAVLQVATGCTFAFNAQRFGWGCLAAYLAASLTFAVFALVELDMDAMTFAGAMAEVFGIPIVAAIVLAFGRPTGSAPRSEAGALLVILGVSSLVGNAMFVVERGRVLSSNFDAMTGDLMLVGMWATVGVFQARAGFHLLRRAPAAERAVKGWLIASLVCEAIMLGLPLMMGMWARDRGEIEWHIALRTVTAIDGIALPFVFWAFIRHHRVPMAEPRVPTTPAWSSLVLVPFLVARPLIVDEAITPRFGAELAVAVGVAFGVQAIATALASRASLQDKVSAGRHALVATIAGLLSTSVILVLTKLDDPRGAQETGPLVPLVVTSAVMVWLHRTATTPVPRAIAKQV